MGMIEGLANGSCEMLEAKSVPVLPQSSPDLNNRKATIEPPTPDSKRESPEEIDKCSSPETLVSSPLSMVCSDSSVGESCDSPMEDGSRTPEGCVFDPFAPGPDKFMLAPLRRKHTDETRTSAARRLNFSSAAVKLVMEVDDLSKMETASNASDENDLYESLYKDILDAIVSEQKEERLGVLSPQILASDECGTPKCAPRLSWVAETCPGAPVKASRKIRNIELDLCRKLEF